MPWGGGGGVGGSRFVPTPQHLLPLGGSVGTHSRGGLSPAEPRCPPLPPNPTLPGACPAETGAGHGPRGPVPSQRDLR